MSFFILGVAASITLFVHIQYVQGVWEAAYPVLTTIMLCGCFTQLAGVVGISTYLAIAIRDKQGRHLMIDVLLLLSGINKVGIL